MQLLIYVEQGLLMKRTGRTMIRMSRAPVTPSQYSEGSSGSNIICNTIVNTLAEGHAGFSAKIQLVSNRLYFEASVRQQHGAKHISYSWGGASYGGLSVNIGHALDVHTLHACHLKPVVLLGRNG